MNSFGLIIVISLQLFTVGIMFYLTYCLHSIEDRLSMMTRQTHKSEQKEESEKKGIPDERKKKISESQKARWAKKKGVNHNNVMAPISWPVEEHQPVS